MLKQELRLKLSQKLSPQQIQLMKLIQLPTLAFEQRVQQELEENPLLESGKEKEAIDEDLSNEFDDEGTEVIETDINVDEYLSDDETPSYKLSTRNYSPDDEEKQIPFASGISFTQYLLTQLRTYRLDETEFAIAEFLVGSIDGSGYLRRDLEDILDDLAFTQNIYTELPTVEAILKTVQTLDPAGVGARDLRECLLLQLDRKSKTDAVELAIEIIKKYFDEFSKKHYTQLKTRLKVDTNTLREGVKEIEQLNPKPGGSYSGNTRIIEHVIPDFTIRIVEGELELTLNGRNAPDLHISNEYSNILKGYRESEKPTKEQKDNAAMTNEEWKTFFNGHWYFPGAKQDKHLAMFPEELPHRLIKMFSFPNETVLDPFMGSGTTALAARNLNRNSIGYEINPEFIPIIKEKIGVSDAFMEVETKIVNQLQIEMSFDEKVKSLPYQFVDTHKLNKKIDVKKIQYGSKIDSNSTGQREEFFSVKEVISSELIRLNNDQTIRLIGIKQDPLMKIEAHDFLINKLRGKKVFLKYDNVKHDADNNLMAYLYLENKTFINAHLLKEKLALVDNSIDFKYKNRFNSFINGK